VNYGIKNFLRLFHYLQVQYKKLTLYLKMQFFQKDYQKRNQISRCFFYKNVHQIPSTIEKVTLFYTLQKEVSLKPLVRISTLLELITNQRAFFIRSRKASISLKIRKGSPLGVKVTLRKNNLRSFLNHLIWEILPNIKNYKVGTKIQKLKLNNFFLKIQNPLVFPVLKPFFFLFKSCTDLRILISLGNTLTKTECFFNIRFAQFPL